MRSRTNCLRNMGWISWCTGTTRVWRRTVRTRTRIRNAWGNIERLSARGVSTTDIVGRLLRLGARAMGEEVEEEEKEATFCTTSSRVAQFLGNNAPPAEDARVVYVHGAFDVFNTGHVEILREAQKLGDFVLVGVHADADVRARRGAAHPVLNEKERALGVLACRYADEVVIGAPAKITNDLLTTFNVSVVVAEDEDPYEIAGEDERRRRGERFVPLRPSRARVVGALRRRARHGEPRGVRGEKRA